MTTQLIINNSPGNFERLEKAGLIDKTTPARKNFEDLKARVRFGALSPAVVVDDLVMAQPGVKADIYKNITAKDLPLLQTLEADQALKFQAVNFLRALHTSFWNQKSLRQIHKFISIQTEVKLALVKRPPTALPGPNAVKHDLIAKHAPKVSIGTTDKKLEVIVGRATDSAQRYSEILFNYRLTSFSGQPTPAAMDGGTTTLRLDGHRIKVNSSPGQLIDSFHQEVIRRIEDLGYEAKLQPQGLLLPWNVVLTISKESR